jgi:hypothetical protein
MLETYHCLGEPGIQLLCVHALGKGGSNCWSDTVWGMQYVQG